MFVFDVPGWIGAFLILLAFWLLTHKVVHSHSYTYFNLNLLGALLLSFESWRKAAHASFVLNIIWAMIAIYGLGWAHKRKPPKMKR